MFASHAEVFVSNTFQRYSLAVKTDNCSDSPNVNSLATDVDMAWVLVTTKRDVQCHRKGEPFVNPYPKFGALFPEW